MLKCKNRIPQRGRVQRHLGGNRDLLARRLLRGAAFWAKGTPWCSLSICRAYEKLKYLFKVGNIYLFTHSSIKLKSQNWIKKPKILVIKIIVRTESNYADGSSSTSFIIYRVTQFLKNQRCCERFYFVMIGANTELEIKLQMSLVTATA